MQQHVSQEQNGGGVIKIWGKILYPGVWTRSANTGLDSWRPGGFSGASSRNPWGQNLKLVFPGITGNGNSRSPLTLPWFISRNIPTILCLLWLNERGCHKYNMKFLIKRCGMVGELGNSNLDFPGGLGPTRGVLRNSSKIHSPLPSPPLLILYSNKFLLSKKTHPALS